MNTLIYERSEILLSMTNGKVDLLQYSQGNSGICVDTFLKIISFGDLISKFIYNTINLCVLDDKKSTYLEWAAENCGLDKQIQIRIWSKEIVIALYEIDIKTGNISMIDMSKFIIVNLDNILEKVIVDSDLVNLNKNITSKRSIIVDRSEFETNELIAPLIKNSLLFIEDIHKAFLTIANVKPKKNSNDLIRIVHVIGVDSIGKILVSEYASRYVKG